MLKDLSIPQFGPRRSPRDFSFHSRLNIIIGHNGAGKTSLLRAVKQAIEDSYVGTCVVADNIPLRRTRFISALCNREYAATVGSAASRISAIVRSIDKAAVKGFPVVALIDDIETFLHPLWQRHILPDLLDAFPDVQFFVTTNSPYVVQSAALENIINLSEAPNPSESAPMYLSVDEVAVMYLGLSGCSRSLRYREMERRAADFYRILRDPQAENELKARAEEEFMRLEAEFSDNPAYAALIRAEYDARNSKPESR